jgi:hypothetical protein
MKTVITWLKNIRLRQIVTVFMAGVLMFIGTACQSGPSVLAKTADEVREEVSEQAVTSKVEGGMNQYSDTDPRQNPTPAEVKAKNLVDRAQRNLTNRTGNPAEAGKRVVEDAPKNAVKIGDDAQRAAEKMGENAKAGAERVKENTEKLVDKTKRETEKALD